MIFSCFLLEKKLAFRINIKPINAGMMRFITHKLNVAANILKSLWVNKPQIFKATSPRANKPTTGGKGMLVCNK